MPQKLAGKSRDNGSSWNCFLKLARSQVDSVHLKEFNRFFRWELGEFGKHMEKQNKGNCGWCMILGQIKEELRSE